MNIFQRKYIIGESHPFWKGDKVGYSALHGWVKRRLGEPTTCENCRKSNLKGRYIHWANKSGDYKRDLSDWIRLCVPCHSEYDRFNKRKKSSNLILMEENKIYELVN